MREESERRKVKVERYKDKRKTLAAWIAGPARIFIRGTACSEAFADGHGAPLPSFSRYTPGVAWICWIDQRKRSKNLFVKAAVSGKQLRCLDLGVGANKKVN